MGKGRKPRHPRRGYRKPKFEGHCDAKWREEKTKQLPTEEFLQRMEWVYVRGIRVVSSLDHLEQLAAEQAEVERSKYYGKEAGG